MAQKFITGQAEQWTDHCAEGVHGPVEAENLSALPGFDTFNQQRISRCTADSFAETVDYPAGQHARPRTGDGNDHLAQCRHAVPGGDQRTFGEPVAEWTDRQLGDRRGTLGRSLDGTDYRRWRAEYHGEVDRQQWVEQFTGCVLEERHRREHPHVTGQPRQGSRSAAGSEHRERFILNSLSVPQIDCSVQRDIFVRKLPGAPCMIRLHRPRRQSQEFRFVHV